MIYRQAGRQADRNYQFPVERSDSIAFVPLAIAIVDQEYELHLVCVTQRRCTWPAIVSSRAPISLPLRSADVKGSVNDSHRQASSWSSGNNGRRIGDLSGLFFIAFFFHFTLLLCYFFEVTIGETSVYNYWFQSRRLNNNNDRSRGTLDFNNQIGQIAFYEAEI